MVYFLMIQDVCSAIDVVQMSSEWEKGKRRERKTEEKELR